MLPKRAWPDGDSRGNWMPAAALLLALWCVTPARGQTTTPTASLSVRVIELGREQTIEQVKIELTRFPEGVLQVAFTDGSGRLEFSRLAPQSYNVRASKEGYRTAEVSVDIRRCESSKSVVVQMQRIPSEWLLAGTLVSARVVTIPKQAMAEVMKGIECLNEKKDAPQAIKHFQDAVRLFPNFYEACFMLGVAHMQMKSYREAQQAFEKAIALNAKFVRPYYPLAVLFTSVKRHEEAERLLLRAIELDPQNWEGPFELARNYANRQLWEKALHYGEIAHARPSPAPKVHLLMADLFSNTGRTDKAIEELEKFIRLDPDSSYLPKAKAAIDHLRKQSDSKK